MEVNRYCKAKCSTTTDRHEYRILSHDTDPYWDEGLIFYPNSRKGFGNRKKKQILMYQVRMYKTWKHNRKSQYKICHCSKSEGRGES